MATVPGEGVGGAVALRLHTDGASRGNPGHAAIGVVIERAEDGGVVEEIAEYLGQATNNVAEYRALIAGLRRAAELGATQVEVWSDSELLVRQMEGRYQVKNEALLPLFAEASRLARRFGDGFRIRHTLRGGNRRADELANSAIDRALGRGSGASRPPQAARQNRVPAQPQAAASALVPDAAEAPRAGPSGGGFVVDMYALARELSPGQTADVGGGLRLARVAPGQSRVAAWALVLRGAVEIGGRVLEPGQACRGGARYRVTGDEDAILLETSAGM